MINVIRFTASWCSPCKALAPIMDEIKTEMSSNTKIQFNVIDVDANRSMATQYNVRSVPTVVVENNGVIIQQLIGVKSKMEYITAINNASFNK
jgi:thioredoxin 1